MITTPTLVLLAALSTPGQTVLLDFYSDYCGPCRSMEPVIHKLVADGYAVQKVNIATQRQLARKYGVSAVPTYILVVNGQERERIVGVASYGQLAGLFPSTGRSGGSVPTTFVATQTSQEVTTPAVLNSQNTRQIAMQATVRLMVEDPTGRSYGTGTIIDTCQDEALVVTCAHIFRDSKGKGTISVDVMAPGARGPVAGYLLKCDFENDVALVAIKPGTTVQPVKVAAKGRLFRVGEPVFSIGCDRGGQPSLQESRITSLNKYKSPANIEVAGQPVIGRSGGGLFDDRGYLIGVCNFADPKDHEGIYAHLTLIQRILDSVNMSRAYEQSAPMIASNGPEMQTVPQRRPPANSSPLPEMPRTMPELPLAESTPSNSVDWWSQFMRQAGNDTEVILLVRSKQNPHLQRTITVDQPSAELLHMLAQETSRGSRPRPTVLDAVGSEADIAVSPQEYDPNRGGPAPRAQSWR